MDLRISTSECEREEKKNATEKDSPLTVAARARSKFKAILKSPKFKALANVHAKVGGRSVRVAINIDHIYSLDTQTQMFTVSFTTIYEWHDSSLSQYKRPEDVDWSKHFWPQVQFEGAVEITEPELSPRIHNMKECIAKLTARYQGTFTAKLNLRHFPFDVHTLALHLKARKWGTDATPKDMRVVRLVSYAKKYCW